METDSKHQKVLFSGQMKFKLSFKAVCSIAAFVFPEWKGPHTHNHRSKCQWGVVLFLRDGQKSYKVKVNY